MFILEKSLLQVEVSISSLLWQVCLLRGCLQNINDLTCWNFYEWDADKTEATWLINPQKIRIGRRTAAGYVNI